ncbi:enoyl-CoA hydratase-related protein [Thalassotalea agarivorans]|uniref:Enoyl-CoA hydratase/carnithine racemase n=1 Tax=Thalassotalea agarivorans TaxID=349064 RepID=A0A1I0H7R2_THASX|nr:enoyl-CoA hydratase-related protein [Thalassotalea agarivorans]SET78913.1 Enoyl-CoA hydratase/carnithine racemase [Thalassotalea agarivorans]
MSNLILTEQRQHVLIITLARFDKKNALNNDMYQQLCNAFDHASQSPDIHCVLIQGNEQCFCAGNDLADFMAQDEDLVAFSFIHTLAQFNKPLVAAVAGAAVGIGTTMLLHCDMVFAAPNAKFKLPFAQLGLAPEAGSSMLLRERLGYNKAFELLVLGNTFSTADALALGIINYQIDESEVLSKALECATAIAKLPHQAVMASRELLRSRPKHIAEAMDEEAKWFKALLASDDCQAILAQFFKR